MSEDFLDTLELTHTLTNPFNIPDSKQNKTKNRKTKEKNKNQKVGSFSKS